MKFDDLTGRRFGRLTVIERVDDRIGPSGQHSTMWKAVCDCGKETVKAASYLKQDIHHSCGCYITDRMVKMNTRHGLRRTRLYAVYHSMLSRTTNPKAKCYDRYGGRGITVCDEWKNNFVAFYDWAISHGYDENAPIGQCTLDRIDNEKGYSPSNCRFATAKEQAANRSKPRKK